MRPARLTAVPRTMSLLSPELLPSAMEAYFVRPFRHRCHRHPRGRRRRSQRPHRPRPGRARLQPLDHPVAVGHRRARPARRGTRGSPVTPWRVREGRACGGDLHGQLLQTPPCAAVDQDRFGLRDGGSRSRVCNAVSFAQRETARVLPAGYAAGPGGQCLHTIVTSSAKVPPGRTSLRAPAELTSSPIENSGASMPTASTTPDGLASGQAWQPPVDRAAAGRRLPRRRHLQAIHRRRTFLEIERALLAGAPTHHLRRQTAQRTTSSTSSTPCWSVASTELRSATASTTLPSRPDAASPTCCSPSLEPPDLASVLAAAAAPAEEGASS